MFNAVIPVHSRLHVSPAQDLFGLFPILLHNTLGLLLFNRHLFFFLCQQFFYNSHNFFSQQLQLFFKFRLFFSQKLHFFCRTFVKNLSMMIPKSYFSSIEKGKRKEKIKCANLRSFSLEIIRLSSSWESSPAYSSKMAFVVLNSGTRELTLKCKL